MKNLDAKYKGILTGLIVIVLSLLFFYGLKLPENGKNQIVILMIYIAGILWSLIAFKLKAEPSATFKDYFSEGFKTFIVVTFFMAVFTFIFYKFNTGILENAIKLNNELILKEGNRTPAEIENNTNQLRSIFVPMMVATKTMLYLFIGATVALIGGLILKPKKV